MNTNDSSEQPVAANCTDAKQPCGLPRRQLWPEIKEAHLAGEGSLRELAERFGVSENTLEKRCAREGWRRELAALCGRATEAAGKAVEERGRELGMSASPFVARSIRECEEWLDRISALASSGKLDADRLAKLVSAWRATLAAGREAFRLDEPNVEPGLIVVGRVEQLALEPECWERKQAAQDSLQELDGPTAGVEPPPTRPSLPA